MSLLDKILSFANISEKIKPWISALAAIGGGILTIGGVKDFLVKNRLTSVDDIYRVVFVTDFHKEIQPILKRVGTETKADRAFIFLYKQNESGQWFTEFRENYQWQVSGQTHIKDALYPLAKGADTARFEAMNVKLCKESKTSKMDDKDPLAIAMRTSGVSAQVACQLSIKVRGVERTGAIAVEFGETPYKRVRVDEILIEASIDVEEIFH